jgi:hypothetical protein
MADLGSIEARLNERFAPGATERDLLEASVGSGIYEGTTANSGDNIAAAMTNSQSVHLTEKSLNRG